MLPNHEIQTHYTLMVEQNSKNTNVHLRNFTSEDIDDFLQWATDDEVTKHLMWESYKSKSEAEQFFANVIAKHLWFKAICLGQKVIGSITLDKGKGAHSCKAELGYVIARKYWSQGCATRAVKEALKIAFQDLEIHRIEAFVDPENIASQKVLEKCGFNKEGYLKCCIMHKGRLRDRLLFAITKNAP